MSKVKSVKLDEKAATLMGLAKSMMLQKDPLSKTTDCDTIKEALSEYIAARGQ